MTMDLDKKAPLTLPQDLGAGLCLRWATADDIPRLVDFNAAIHEETPEDAGTIRTWVQDLLSGHHPTIKADDFTIVVDTTADHQIVSSLCTIPQTWAYEGIPFAVGRIELVGTLPAYRQRGLIRRQMAAVHAKGAARGELMQTITGIPWYYRQFGYEMALDLGGGRHYIWERRGNLRHLPDADEPYSWRTATLQDIPLLDTLYQIHSQASQITTVRDEAVWRYELTGHHEPSIQVRQRWLIQHRQEGEVAYVQFAIWAPNIVIHELAVKPNHSWRAVCLYLTRLFKGLANIEAEKEKKKLTHLVFRLGEAHPAYQALGRQLEKPVKPYAWYVRLPDLPVLVRHIQPVLEARLAQSIMAGHTGTLRLNFYRGGTLQLTFKEGRLTALAPYQKRAVADGDAHFPDLLFTQLLCGRRSLVDLNYVSADCYGTAEAEILLGILFPKRPSQPSGLG